MSKAVSYYDWNLAFKQKPTPTSDDKFSVNSLGISDNNFKEFIKKWKEKNLS
ncbi:MAG: hypothetical protein ACFE8N_13380 [Promethearchaeota archaeon]